MIRVLTTFATLALLGGVLAGTALAHAEYTSSYPQPGQTLTASPAGVAITFSEDLAAGSTGVVTNAGGATVSTSASVSTTDRKQMTIALTPGLPNGLYRVNWHSISADDGDSVDGTFYFGVNVPAAGRALTMPSTSTAPLPATDTTGVFLALLAFAIAAVLLSTRAAGRRA